MPEFKKLLLLIAALTAASASVAGPLALEEAVRALVVGKPIAYSYSLTDLNGDGELDAVVMLHSSDWCGSGGCSMAVFRGTPNGFKFISRCSVARAPIAVLAESNNGWRTIVTTVGGGGAKPGQTLLRFNGKRYPSNPTTQPYASPHDLLGVSVLEFNE